MTDRPNRAATLFRAVRGGKRTASLPTIQVEARYGCTALCVPLSDLRAGEHG